MPLTIIENTYQEAIFIEMRRDTMLPNPNGKDLVKLPAQSQLCWTRKSAQPGCAGCGSGTLIAEFYYATGFVGGDRFDNILPIPANLVVETTMKRIPNPCTFLSDDKRGVDVDILTPPHLRKNYVW